MSKFVTPLIGNHLGDELRRVNCHASSSRYRSRAYCSSFVGVVYNCRWW